MPFCQPVLHGLFVVCVILGVPEQEGQSKQQPLLHPLVLARGLGMAGKALGMLGQQEFPPKLGLKQHPPPRLNLSAEMPEGPVCPTPVPHSC